MTTALKLGIGVAVGVGTIGSAVGITYAVSNKEEPKILTIKEELERESAQLLSTSMANGNSDDTNWDKLATEHAKTEAEITKNEQKIKKLDIPNQPESNAKNQLIAKQLKIKCDNLLSKNSKSEGYAQAKIDAKNWCSKSSPLLT